MILVTGGLGFIGSHTAQALLDLGEDCIVTQHRAADVPEFLRIHLGERVVVEPLDVEDGAVLRRLGDHYAVTGIVHLADPAIHHIWRQADDFSPMRLDGLLDGLGNILRAAEEWGVNRVTIASTIGVYAGLPPGIWREDSALPPVTTHAIPTVKRCAELLSAFAGAQLGLEVVAVRPSAIWGPRGRPSSPFVALPALVHAAARRDPEGAQTTQFLHADDGADLCYVKDCGRAIALVQTATKLLHPIYNIGAGATITNASILAAIRREAPDFDVDLAPGRSATAAATDPVLDLTRIREDTGYEPAYDLDAGIADYLGWLRDGHDR